MSTTFGVTINDKIEPIAFRRGAWKGVNVTFTNEVARLLPDETEVIAIDNSSQGINTIGDLKESEKGNSIT